MTKQGKPYCVVETIATSSSSYRLLSISRWCVHSELVVLHILHRGQRDTILYTYLVNFSTLYSLTLPQPGSLPFLSPTITLPYHPCPPPLTPLLPPLPLPYRCLPSPTTASPPTPPVFSPLPHISP